MLTVVAWQGATGWTTWHILALDKQHTLCDLSVPAVHLMATTAPRVCKRCGQKFLEPLI